MTAGKTNLIKTTKREKVSYFYTVSKLRVLQTYKAVHLNKQFEEKVEIRVSAPLGQITTRDTKSLPFYNLSKKHSVSSRGAS